MSSEAEGIQKSTTSETQKKNIINKFEDEEDDNTNSVTAQLDITSIILQVLRSFNDASLGSTEVSGGLIVDDITVNDILFSSDGQILDISDIRLDISNLKTSVSYFSSIITEISTNLFILDSSNVKIDIFNDLSSSHYSLYNRVNDLSINFSNLENKINDISFIFDNFELSNNRILVKLSMDISNLLITSNDFSFSYLETLDNSDNFVLSLKQLNELLGTYNFATTQDLNSINVDISSSFEYVNEINQTFYEIMTQQPYKFKKSTTNPTQRSTSEITINWTFDHLIADHSNNSVYKAQLANSDNIKLAQLPFIDKIQIDISGKFEDGRQSEWLNLSTIIIPSDICYNTNNYKSLTIAKPGNANYNFNDVNNLLNNNNYFNLRVYGINNAINYPSIEERALIYEFLRFEGARPPSAPSIMSDIANGLSEIIITFYVTNTEKDISNSSAKIKEIDISYSLNESLRSSYISFNSTDYDVKSFKETYINNLKEQNEQFSPKLTGLYPGSNYNYQGRVLNNLTNDLSYSEYSTISLSNYTNLPAIQNGTNIDFSVDDAVKMNITNNDFVNNQVIYINLSDSNNNLQFQSSGSLQVFEVTNPNASVNDNYGYGKFLDSMPSNSALVTITVYVDDVSKQTIIYDNSFTRSNVINNYSHSYFVNSQLSIGDAITSYSTLRKGFRLRGTLQINNITNSSIIQKIGVPSSSPYKLTFEYLRHNDVNGINTSVDHNIYIDDFSGIPVINNMDNSNVVTEIVNNMGIPSVKSFNLKMERNYNNINSEHLYILSSKKISKINPINNTSANGEKYIYIKHNLNNNPEILPSGSYFYNYNEFDSATNDYYKNLNYTNSLLTNNYNLSWNEIVYNLYSTYKTDGNTFTISHVTNHFCDYNSFDLSNQKINNSKLNLTLINVYEIDNINELGNNINNLTISRYTDHDNLVKDSTLLYIDGKFRSNTTSIYPDLNSYNYNGMNINNIYSTGNISYDLSGISTGTNNNGYKFIVFKISKNPNDNTSHGSYIFNDTIYNVIDPGGGVPKYLNIGDVLFELFESHIIDALFEESNLSTIGFVKVTKTNTGTRFGNLNKNFNPTGGAWIENGAINTSITTPSYYNTLEGNYIITGSNNVSYSFGCKVLDGNNKGIQISYNSIDDDLTLFIGIKK